MCFFILFSLDRTQTADIVDDDIENRSAPAEENNPEEDNPEENLVKLKILILSKTKSQCICCPRECTRKSTTLPKKARIQVFYHNSKSWKLFFRGFPFMGMFD